MGEQGSDLPSGEEAKRRFDEETARRIEIACAEANARLAATLARDPDPRKLPRRIGEFLLECFDIYAHANLSAVWDRAGITTFYDPFLLRLKHTISADGGDRSANWPPSLNRDRFQSQLSLELAARIAHWKTEALKRAYQMEQSAPVEVEQSAPVESEAANREPRREGLKRGPKPDYENAALVAEIVARVAPDGDWRSRRDDVCEALDEAKVPIPRTWRKGRKCKCWCDCVERDIVIKAIEYRLDIAREQKKATPATFS
jgi:hypothetical protein